METETQPILALICEALEIPEGSLTLTTAVDEVEEWDSIGWLTIMSFLDERYGIQINAQEIRNVQTVADLVEIISQKKGA